jgi:hypothetical protein
LIPIEIPKKVGIKFKPPNLNIFTKHNLCNSVVIGLLMVFQGTGRTTWNPVTAAAAAVLSGTAKPVI